MSDGMNERERQPALPFGVKKVRIEFAMTSSDTDEGDERRLASMLAMMLWIVSPITVKVGDR